MARPNKPRSVGNEANLARRIARERESRGLSMETLASMMTEAGCSMPGSAIYKIEKSDPPRKISVDELVTFARVFGLTVDNLLTPIEVLDKQRAHELLREMTEAMDAWDEAVQRVILTHAEFYELAGDDPDLYEYLSWQRFPDPKTDPRFRDPDLPRFDPKVPGYDPEPFDWNAAGFDLTMRMQSIEIANARLERKGKAPIASMLPKFQSDNRKAASDGR